LTDKNDTKRGIEAEAVITEAEKLRLSERDSLRVLDLLENPPEPTPALRRAFRRHRELIQEFEPRGVRSPARDVEL
jgi:hypothetical protein